jgi:uncharacterized protein involved in propanediol utilization
MADETVYAACCVFARSGGVRIWVAIGWLIGFGMAMLIWEAVRVLRSEDYKRERRRIKEIRERKNVGRT